MKEFCHCFCISGLVCFEELLHSFFYMFFVGVVLTGVFMTFRRHGECWRLDKVSNSKIKLRALQFLIATSSRTVLISERQCLGIELATPATSSLDTYRLCTKDNPLSSQQNRELRWTAVGGWDVKIVS